MRVDFEPDKFHTVKGEEDAVALEVVRDGDYVTISPITNRWDGRGERTEREVLHLSVDTARRLAEALSQVVGPVGPT